MSIIVLFKALGALIGAGISLYFIYMIMDSFIVIVNSTNIYWLAMLTMFASLPGVIMIGVFVRAAMESSKEQVRFR